MRPFVHPAALHALLARFYSFGARRDAVDNCVQLGEVVALVGRFSKPYHCFCQHLRLVFVKGFSQSLRHFGDGHHEGTPALNCVYRRSYGGTTTNELLFTSLARRSPPLECRRQAINTKAQLTQKPLFVCRSIAEGGRPIVLDLAAKNGKPKRFARPTSCRRNSLGRPRDVDSVNLPHAKRIFVVSTRKFCNRRLVGTRKFCNRHWSLQQIITDEHAEADRAYWLSKTSQERLADFERLRIEAGRFLYDNPDRLPRIIETFEGPRREDIA
jgi:hypothetical protein